MFDHFGEVVEFGAIELADFFELFLDVDVFEFGKVFVEVLGDGFAGGFDNGVPLFAVEIFGEGQFVHDEVILHLSCNLYYYLIVGCKHSKKSPTRTTSYLPPYEGIKVQPQELARNSSAIGPHQVQTECKPFPIKAMLLA